MKRAGARQRLARAALGAVLTGAVLTGMASAADGASAARKSVLRILVTNDDGYNAPGIDAVVQALVRLPGVKVTVAAPATNQSGKGSSATGSPTATKLATASGYPAYAVNVTPVDSVTWALANLPRPQLVVSGINDGQNLGGLTAVSGTVGAAKAAARAGIPALAVSQGLGQPAAFATGATFVVKWVRQHRAALLKHKKGAAATVDNLNVPTCTTGKVRGEVKVPNATTTQNAITTPDCTSTATATTDDITAFHEGYATLSTLSG
jgi:5'-nucleotidase